MDIDTAKAMLTLLLGKKWPLFSSFHTYLDVSPTIPVWLHCMQCYINIIIYVLQLGLFMGFTISEKNHVVFPEVDSYLRFLFPNTAFFDNKEPVGPYHYHCNKP